MNAVCCSTSQTAWYKNKGIGLLYASFHPPPVLSAPVRVKVRYPDTAKPNIVNTAYSLQYFIRTVKTFFDLPRYAKECKIM